MDSCGVETEAIQGTFQKDCHTSFSKAVNSEECFSLGNSCWLVIKVSRAFLLVSPEFVSIRVTDGENPMPTLPIPQDSVLIYRSLRNSSSVSGIKGRCTEESQP